MKLRGFSILVEVLLLIMEFITLLCNDTDTLLYVFTKNKIRVLDKEEN